MSDQQHHGRSNRRQFLAAACAPVLAACVGCGGAVTPNTKQLNAAGDVLITIGAISITIPSGWGQIVGVVLVVAGGVLKLYVLFADGGRSEIVKANTEQLQAIEEAQSKGEMAVIKQNGTQKKVEIGKDK